MSAESKTVLESSNSRLEHQRHPEECGPYPFNPQTAFQGVQPTVEDFEDELVLPVETELLPAPDHSDEKEAMPYESLVGNSEVIGIEFVSQDSYSNRLYVDTDVGHYDSQHRHGGSQYNRRGSRDYQETPISTSPPQIYIDTTSVQPQYEDNFVPLEDFPDDYGPISPLRRGWDSIRGPLSRSHSAVSSIGTSRANSLSTRPSQRSHRGTSRSTSLSSRFSFRRSRSSGRTRDIEMGAGNYIPGEQIEGIDPVELESLAHTFGPFELYSLDSREQGRLLRRAAVGNQKTVPHKRIIENLFGLHLCSPQYHGLRRTYMAQVDKKLKGALYESSVANPNPAVWPKPFAYLVGFLGLVSQQMEPTSSVTAFILSHMDDFAEMIRNGNISPPEKSQSSSLPSGGEKAAMAIAWGFDDTDNFTPWHQKIVHEWMLFSLESWFMLDLYPSNDNRRDLVSSQTFCESSIQDLIKPHLPETAFRSSWLSPTGSQPSIIVSGDVTASMLQRWNGITFRWTPNIKDHLQFDSRNNVLMLYENVAFCQLHSIAKENSSLHKAGFNNHHRLVLEIYESYRLLFGPDHISQACFAELGKQDTSGGFFDIFLLLNHGCEASYLQYNVANDFPVYGERLLVLKTLLKPNGIRGLWRDKRDSLQWYTFWAVVILGCFGATMALLQLVLSVLQTWATIKGMNNSRV